MSGTDHPAQDLHPGDGGEAHNRRMPVCNATDCPLRREYESALVLEREATHQRADEAHVLRLAVVDLRHQLAIAVNRLRHLGVAVDPIPPLDDHA